MYMKKYPVVMVIIFLGIYTFGCAKKETPVEVSQEQLTLESMSSIVPESETPVLEPLPPAGPYKPTNEEIQTALKNAGYYTGEIDGKIGPLSRKAIEEFQKANALIPDGVVGPKTWALLSKHLSPQPAPATQAPVKKR
jgi:peptidoglycan hydrolase-like protein with peptidoglycan-binding domain